MSATPSRDGVDRRVRFDSGTALDVADARSFFPNARPLGPQTTGSGVARAPGFGPAFAVDQDGLATATEAATLSAAAKDRFFKKDSNSSQEDCFHHAENTRFITMSSGATLGRGLGQEASENFLKTAPK